jgi:hypothetical protein
MNSKMASASCLLLLAVFASAARAATVEITKGEVLLDRGNGYHVIQRSMALQPGDRVVSRPGSIAKITFADGCAIYLGMGMVFSVDEYSPCGEGNEAAKHSSVTRNAGSEQVVNAENDGWNAGTQILAIAEDSEVNIWPYVVGGVAIGGIAAAVLALGGGGDAPPVSP